MRHAVFATYLALAAMIRTQAAAQTPIPPSSPDFAAAAAQSDQYEIHASQDALAQSHDPRIRAFAEQMIQDHTKTIDHMKEAAEASAMAPPLPSMSSDQSMMLYGLQSLRGERFDRAYIKQQILAHQQALAITQSYATSGADQNLRKAAQSSLPVIQHHLDMAEKLQADFSGT